MDLNNILIGERRLRKLNIIKASDLLLKWDEIKEIRESITENAESLMQNDINEYAIVGIDHRVWNASFYQHIKLLQFAKNQKSPNQAKYTERFLELIEMSNRYYQRLIYILKAFFGLDPEKCFKRNTNPPSIDDTNFRQYYAMYKVFLYLGDINRYIHEHRPANFTYLKRAVDYYECAKWSDPSRGRAFYQIGLISRMRNDLVSAMYNFTRSYAADQNTDNSKDVLLDIYDSAYKTFRNLEYRFWYVRCRLQDPGTARKRQIWLFYLDPTISFTAPQCDNLMPDTKKSHFKNMSLQELSNNFTINFVHFIGKCFTRIGLESVNEVAESALVYLEEIVTKEYSNLFPLNRGTQIMSLIMYIINYIRYGFQCKEPKEIDSLKYLRQIVVNFALECFSILCDKLHKMIVVCDWDNPFIETLSCLVNLWCLWIKKNWPLCTKFTTCPIFSVRRLENIRNDNLKNYDNDVWEAYAKMLSRLDFVMNKLSSGLFPKIYKLKDADIPEDVINLTPLEELTIISNFQGVKISSMSKEFFVSKSAHHLKRAKLFVRFKLIHALGVKFYANNKKYKLGLIRGKPSGGLGIEFKSIAKYDKCTNFEEAPGIISTNPHFWLSDNQNMSREKITKKVLTKTDSNQSRVILSAIKNPLKKPCLPPINITPNHKKWLTLHQHRFFSIMVVTPKKIVMDTNCFIQQFELVKKLVEIVRDPILIPVAVILELRGLQKGGLTNKDIRKYGSADNPDAKVKLAKNKETAARCKIVIEYISANFGSFRVVTQTGTYLNLRNINSYLRDDFFDPSITNDDRILNTCRYLTAYDNKANKQGSPQVMFRNTVLITGDRNLRLKTYSYDIPTRHLGSFILWSYKYRACFERRFKLSNVEGKGGNSPYASSLRLRRETQAIMKKISLVTSGNEKKRKKKPKLRN